MVMRRTYQPTPEPVQLRNGRVTSLDPTGTVSLDIDGGTMLRVPVSGETPAPGEWVRVLTTPYSALVLGPGSGTDYGVFMDDPTNGDMVPSDFPRGITVGSTGTGLPTLYGVVETVYVNANRAVQRVTEKDGVEKRVWHRAASSDKWGAWVLDAGWTPKASLAGYLINGMSGSLTAETRGPVTEIVGALTGPVDTGTSVFEIAAGIPVQYRPVGENRFGAAFLSGMSLSCAVRPNGTMALNNRGHVVSGNNPQLTVVYFAG